MGNTDHNNRDLKHLIALAILALVTMTVLMIWAEKPAEAAESDRYVLAHLLAGECQGESWDMQIAVGSVVLNRVRSKHYPDSIREVVFDRNNGIQYACTRDGNYNRSPTKRNWKAADWLLEHGSQLPAGVLHQSQKKLGPVYERIGNQYFCYGE